MPRAFWSIVCKKLTFCCFDKIPGQKVNHRRRRRTKGLCWLTSKRDPVHRGVNSIAPCRKGMVVAAAEGQLVTLHSHSGSRAWTRWNCQGLSIVAMVAERRNVPHRYKNLNAWFPVGCILCWDYRVISESIALLQEENYGGQSLRAYSLFSLPAPPLGFISAAVGGIVQLSDMASFCAIADSPILLFPQ